MSDRTKATLFILSVLLAVGLLYAIDAMACNISCSGSEAGVVVIIIGGAVVTVFLLIIVIRAIIGKKKAPKKMEINPDNPAKTGS